MLEMDPAFNAGIGAALGNDEQIELDASIMDGKTLACGAVAGLVQTPIPSSVARALMEKTGHIFLAGEGANTFAKEHGFEQLPRERFHTPYQEHLLKTYGPPRLQAVSAT